MRKHSKDRRPITKPYLQVRLAMLQKGITQDELATKMGIGTSTLNKKLNGKSPWLLDECYLLVDILDESFDSIFLPEMFPNGNNKKGEM